MKLFIICLFSLFSHKSSAQLRPFTHQEDIVIKDLNDFNDIFICPEKWINDGQRLELRWPCTVTITVNEKFLFITTPNGSIRCQRFNNKKIANSYKLIVQIIDNNSPYRGTMGEVIFFLNKQAHPFKITYNFPSYSNGILLLSSEKNVQN